MRTLSGSYNRELGAQSKKGFKRDAIVSRIATDNGLPGFCIKLETYSEQCFSDSEGFTAIPSRVFCLGVTIISSDGSTSRDATAAMNIITAVSIPYDENMGIGAKAMMSNPTMLLAAEAKRATPVPLDPLARASRLPADFDSSSRYLSVM